MPDHTYAIILSRSLTQTYSFAHMHSHKHTYMHTFRYTTVVKRQAWILVNQSARQTLRQMVSALFFTSDFQSLCSQARMWLADSVQFAMAADILQNDIIACSNWRIKMLLQNIWKKSFKILYFFLVFLLFFPSCSASSFNPPKSLVGEDVARDHVCPCDALLLLILCVYLIFCWRVYVLYVKCQIGCVQVQVWLCVCWLGCGFITPQRSRRSPPQLSAVSHKVCRKTHREGCLSD